MAEEEEYFTSLGPGQADKSEPDLEQDSEQDSELNSTLNTDIKIKPSNYNTNTSNVAPIVKQELVEIDDELFKKILFFMLFRDVIFFKFSDINQKIDNEIFLSKIKKKKNTSKLQDLLKLLLCFIII